MNLAKTRAVIIGGALLLVVALGAFWLLPKNQVDETTPNDAESALLTPSPETSETETPEVVADTTDDGQVAGVVEYVVAADESLSKIAEKFYGDSTMYWLIEWYNEDTLKGNIDVIPTNTKLVIPDKSKANEPKPGTEKPNTQQQPKTNDTQKTDPTKSNTTQPNTQPNTTPTPAPGR